MPTNTTGHEVNLKKKQPRRSSRQEIMASAAQKREERVNDLELRMAKIEAAMKTQEK